MGVSHEGRALSALLINGDMMSALSYNASSLFVSHKPIWDFIYHYYRNNKEVPPATIVVEEFPLNFEYLPDLQGATKHYLDKLRIERNKSSLGMILAGAKDAIDGGDNADEVMSYLAQRVSEVQREAGSSRSIDIRDIDSASDEFNRRRELAALHGGQIGIPTGFKYIDDNYPTGFAPGHFVVGLGYSGLGKTWFIIQLAINAWKKGYRPLIINLEMSPEELRDRVIFLISHYSMDELVKAELDEDDFISWGRDFMRDKVSFDIVGYEGFGSFTTDMVAGKIEQFKPDIVFLDYLQLFSDRASSTNDVTRARATAREVKEVAMASQVPIVVISAVTGKDKKDRLVAPSLAQVAWSSEIEYAANFAFAVHTVRDAQTQQAGPTEIVGLKNRHGGLFSFNIKMDLVNGIIEEIREEDQFAWEDSKDPVQLLAQEQLAKENK